jgi:hypothetical protein
MCLGCDEIIYASEVSYDGPKLGCGDNVIKPCDKLSTVIQTLFNIACKKQVLFSVEKLGNGTVTGVLTSTSYTVPTGMGGTYEIEYYVDCVLPGGGTANILLDARKNTLVINNDAQRSVVNSNAAAITANQVFKLTNISLSPGDTIDMYATISGPAGTYPARGICIITKIG